MENLTNKWNALSAVPFTSVNINDKFWSPKLKAHKETTINVCLDQCEKTGRISNFAKAAGLEDGAFEGIFYNDSDVYKVLEGAAYSLMTHPDKELEKRIDDIIDLIASAQEDDGYLLAYFTLKPEGKWTDMDKHEMYCGGHLIEAAVAYYKATGKRKLLDVAIKLADHYDSMFGPDKRDWVPGHEEIELALVKLYKETKNERYWKLAEWLLEERGHGHGDGTLWEVEEWGAAIHCQDDKPIREMTDVSGHAVRATYLYSGMADVAPLNGDEGYMEALDRVWDSAVNRNMYITGGIGQSSTNEGFTEDYDLPNETAYAETCASVGMVLWNHRMNLLYKDSKFADILERAMYNGAIAGVSLSGDRFFYVNPLSSKGDHHRVEWFNTSCCPTQIARFMPSIGNYVYATSENGVYTNLYMEGVSTLQVNKSDVDVTQTTNYPWDGAVQIDVNPENSLEFDFYLRYPGWCKSIKLYLNGEKIENYQIDKGYIKLSKVWQKGDKISFYMDMPVEKVKAHPKVTVNQGKVALQRGPLVYCLEEVDNAFDFATFEIKANTKFICEYKEDLLDGVTVIKGICDESQPYFTAIPYYAWDNRKPGKMDVWLKEEKGWTSLYK